MSLKKPPTAHPQLIPRMLIVPLLSSLLPFRLTIRVKEQSQAQTIQPFSPLLDNPANSSQYICNSHRKGSKFGHIWAKLAVLTIVQMLFQPLIQYYNTLIFSLNHQQYLRYNQMQEDEFDEFQEATYNASTTHTQNANSSHSESNPPIQAHKQTQEQSQAQIIQPFYSLSDSLANSFPADLQPSSQSEQVWPHLGKISSAHEPTQNTLFLDFTKNNSLNERKNNTEQQEAFHFTNVQASQHQNNIFLPAIESRSNGATEPKIQNHDFLFGFSSQENKLDTEKGSNYEIIKAAENKVGIFGWQAITQNSISNAPNFFNENDYGIFNQPTSKIQQVQQTNFLSQYDMPISSQHQNTQVKENPSPIQNNIFSFEEENQIQLQSDFATPSNVEIDIRKQSQEFVFGQKEQAPTEHRQEQRKQSEQFVFQQQVNQPIQYQQPQFEQLPQNEVNQPQQVSVLPSIEPQKAVQQAIVSSEEDDDFGDFQQSTANNEAEAVISQTNEQNSIVHVKEEYLNSHQSQFYRTKEKELQKFVNSLPDFSFLFKKAFAV